MLDRLALIATLFKAILHGVFAGVFGLVPRPLKPLLWVALALALASCVIAAT